MDVHNKGLLGFAALDYLRRSNHGTRLAHPDGGKDEPDPTLERLDDEIAALEYRALRV